MAYWAGIIDGEGCVGIYRYNNKNQWHKSATYSPTIMVAMNSKEMIDGLNRIFPGSRALRDRHKNPNQRPTYYWSRRGLLAIDAITKLLPYLRLKLPQAQLAIKFMKAKGPNPCRLLTDEERQLRESFYNEMRILNAKGSNHGQQNPVC